MICTLCGEELFVHKNKDTLSTYCQQCGNETSEKIVSRPDRWTPEQRELRLIQGGEDQIKKTSVNHRRVSPPSKKKKKRRG